jgi:uncharacterized membrane protein YsdA (DUF1294 family)
MCYTLFFGFLSVILTAVAYTLLFEAVTWHPYLTWLVSINGVTLLMYGIDSVLGKQGKVETPETVMHLLSAGGGFVGTWLARAIFRYKVDWKGNPWVYIVLLVSAVGHGVLAWNWLIKGSGVSGF